MHGQFCIRNFLADVADRSVRQPTRNAPFLKGAYTTVFEFAKIAIFRSITLYKSAEMVVTVRGCCKRVHVGDVGTPSMGRTDGALDIEALCQEGGAFLIKAYYQYRS
eukprot:SAG11_NODE_5247_length_1616_cov_7.811470_1_plen_107_part_00